MDLVSLLKDNGVPLARFAKKQLMVWFAVVRNPLAFISKINLRSTKAVTPALGFIVFVYVLTLLVAFPKMFLYQHVDVSNEIVVLTDFVLTALTFGLVGLTLYAAGKLLGGRGGLLESMVAGLYLTAFWPFVQLTDYVLSPKLSSLDKQAAAMVRFILFVIVAVLVGAWIVVKVAPVMAHVHRFGRVRAAIAVLIQECLIVVSILVYLRPLFDRLAGKTVT